MLLCDAAQVAEGKLNLLGGGWTETTAGAAPHSIAMLFHVPWNDANRRLRIRLSLMTSDGQSVMQQGPLGELPIQIDGEFEVGRPAGTPQGASIDVPIAINVPPLPLAAGARYLWKLFIDDASTPDYELPFSTRPPLGGPLGASGIGPAGLPGPGLT